MKLHMLLEPLRRFTEPHMGSCLVMASEAVQSFGVFCEVFYETLRALHQDTSGHGSRPARPSQYFVSH